MSLLDFLQEKSEVVILSETPEWRIENSYYKMKLAGTLPVVFIRESLQLLIQGGLKKLGPDWGVLVFDAFRSMETQRALFEDYYQTVKSNHRGLSHPELRELTREFISDPEGPHVGGPPPHNSGGAIDFVLTYKGKALDMGTGFDEFTPLSYTSAFEADPAPGWDPARWREVQKHRNLMLTFMEDLGFCNYPHEWWHFSLGDRMWAKQAKIAWSYPSAEPAVLKKFSEHN